MTRRGTGLADPGFPFAVFAALWALAALFETARSFAASGSLAVILSILLVRIGALWVLVGPRDVRRFVLLNAALVLSIFLRLPKMNNHGIFVMLVAATAVFAYLRVRPWRSQAPVAPEQLFAALAPLLRWSLLAMYFWATVHKLNTDFFAPEVSCGPMQLFNVQRQLPFLPTDLPLQYFAIYGTLAVEGGIPLLLAFRRTRYLGILLAGGFHYVLGAGYPGFSAMLFAMLALFAPDSFYAALARRVRLPERLREQPWFRPGALAARAGGLLGACAAALVVGTLATLLFFPVAGLSGTGPPLLDKPAVLGLWLAYGAVLGALFVWTAWSERPWPVPGGALRPQHASLVLLPLLVFANGLLPHIGVKNTQAYAMFSNLHTAGGETNHLFLPRSLQVFDLERDLVTIHASSDPVLAKLVGPSWRQVNYFSSYVVGRERVGLLHDPPTWRIPYVALRRRITDLARSGHQDVEVTYERNGELRHVDRAERDPELSRLPFLARKFLLMRPVPEPARYCMW